jgi:hypothetical protein
MPFCIVVEASQVPFAVGQRISGEKLTKNRTTGTERAGVYGSRSWTPARGSVGPGGLRVVQQIEVKLTMTFAKVNQAAVAVGPFSP